MLFGDLPRGANQEVIHVEQIRKDGGDIENGSTKPRINSGFRLMGFTSFTRTFESGPDHQKSSRRCTQETGRK